MTLLWVVCFVLIDELPSVHLIQKTKLHDILIEISSCIIDILQTKRTFPFTFTLPLEADPGVAEYYFFSAVPAIVSDVCLCMHWAGGMDFWKWGAGVLSAFNLMVLLFQIALKS